MQWTQQHVFAGRLVMLGFGCIGQGALPLLLRHIDMRPEQILVVDPDESTLRIARGVGAQTLLLRVTPGNLRESLLPRLRRGDFLLNLSVDVSSTALIQLCRDHGVLYMDTDPEHPVYRPTVHYAYQPCDDAVLSLHELAALNWQVQTGHRVMKEEIVSGMDELGVLLMGHARGAYWYGSRLTIEQARALAPHNSATSLQVTAAVMAGVVSAMKNPGQDVVEPDDLPFDEMLALIRPYLGDVVGVYSDWNPLQGRAWLFDEDIDRADPWQFKNFRVT